MVLIIMLEGGVITDAFADTTSTDIAQTPGIPQTQSCGESTM
jgi:hypothetical protein